MEQSAQFTEVPISYAHMCGPLFCPSIILACSLLIKHNNWHVCCVYRSTSGSRESIALETLFTPSRETSLCTACITTLIFYDNAHQYSGSIKRSLGHTVLTNTSVMFLHTHTHIHTQVSVWKRNQNKEGERKRNKDGKEYKSLCLQTCGRLLKLPVDSPSPNFLTRKELLNGPVLLFTSSFVFNLGAHPQTNVSLWTEEHETSSSSVQFTVCSVKNINVVIYMIDWIKRRQRMTFFFYMHTFAEHSSLVFPSFLVAFEKVHIFKRHVKLCYWQGVKREDFNSKESTCLPLLSLFNLLPSLQNTILHNNDITVMHVNLKTL